MQKRATVRDVAEAAKVHLSTAARALKDDPRISAATRQRVRAAAKRVGYVADPMMAAFAMYRQKVRSAAFQGTLAWVTNYPTADSWRYRAADLYFQGARDRALEFGYHLEEFWLRERGMTARRASNILHARGIRGLLLCPQPRPRGHLSLAWDRFSVVAFGYSMLRPKVHLVTTSHFRSVVTTVRQLRALGHRRIGWACPRHMDERMDHLWTAAFQSIVSGLPESQGIPLFTNNPFYRLDFMQWFERWRPTAIIVTYDTPVAEWLKVHGYRVPEQVSVAVLNLQSVEEKLSGIDERSRKIGSAAVDLLAGMLQRGEYGIPADPLVVLVEGSWVNGSTTAHAPGAKPEKALESSAAPQAA